MEDMMLDMESLERAEEKEDETFLRKPSRSTSCPEDSMIGRAIASPWSRMDCCRSA